jgi:septal ring factor EnvC (AmiA/AmiB activator)
MTSRPALAAALAAALAGSARAQAPDRQGQVERDVRAHEEALNRLRDQASSILDALAVAEEDLQSLRAAALEAEAAARLSAARVQSAQKEEAAAREGLVAQLDLLAPRLRARYRLGRAQRADLLLSAPSVGELLRRRRALETLLESDLKLLKGARSALDELAARTARLEERRREHARREAEARERRARAQSHAGELAALHASLLAEQGLRERALDELYQTQARLDALVDGLPAEGAGSAVRFGRRRGKLRYPTAGTLEVGFGKVVNPKFNTTTYQKGIDLRAPLGSVVVAVAPGKVVHAGPFRGYGNLVIVDHGGGYHTLYAHLGSMAKAAGDPVGEGEALGTVGDTGSLKGAYLYFELRENGAPVDPKAWLGAPPSAEGGALGEGSR